MLIMQKMEKQNQQQHNYLKRTQGKNNGDVKKIHFWLHYKANAKLPVVNKSTYHSFTTDLVTTLIKAVVLENLEVKLKNIGYIRIRSDIRGSFNTKDGRTSFSYKVDWKTTWELWHKKYPNLTREEILQQPDKKIYRYDNQHSSGEMYKFYWDKLTCSLLHKNFYNFTPVRAMARLLAKTIKDPNRKIYYYG